VSLCDGEYRLGKGAEQTPDPKTGPQTLSQHIHGNGAFFDDVLKAARY